MKKWINKLAAIFISLTIGLLIGELVLRLVGFSYVNFYVVDPNVGMSLRPGAEGWFTIEGKSYVKINAHGFRDRERLIEKPENTIRIAILGDSFSEAMQVDQDKTFWSVMEKKLNRCGLGKGKRIEVLNFGVAGFGTAQELITLRMKVFPFSPDLIVHAFFAYNDIRDNLRGFDKDPNVPYFVYRDGELALDNSFRDSPSFKLRHSFLASVFLKMNNYFRVLQLINKVRHTLGAKFRKMKTFDSPGGKISREEIIKLLYRENDHPLWIKAWKITEDLIVKMKNEVDARGMKFMTVSLGNKDPAHPKAEVRKALMDELGVKDLFYPENRIRALAEKEKFRVLNLAPFFLEHVKNLGTYLYGFGPNLGNGHWNENGHRLGGELMADYICENFSF